MWGMRIGDHLRETLGAIWKKLKRVRVGSTRWQVIVKKEGGGVFIRNKKVCERL